MARHRAPSAFERRRDRALDTLADVGDALPNGRALSACAVSGVLVVGGVTAGVQALGSGPAAAAETGAQPTAVIATPLVHAQRVSDIVAMQQSVDEATAEQQARADGVKAASERAERERAAAAKRAEKRAEERRKAAAEARAEAARKKALENADPRTVARAMLADFGWDEGQFSCLDNIWSQESGWQVDAENPSSGAYGIPQSLPASKMASAGSDWQTNPATQIRWGLGYIQDRYGSPCEAWSFKQGAGWY
jgi:hypothetical protein